MKKQARKAWVMVVAVMMAIAMVLPASALAVGTRDVGVGNPAVGKYEVTSVKLKNLKLYGLTTYGKTLTKLKVGGSIEAGGVNSGTYKVTKIAKNALKGSSATKVVLMSSVNNFEDYAFSGSKVTTIEVRSATITAKKAKNMLKGAKASKITIKVPKSVLSRYKKSILTKQNTGFSGTLVIKSL